MESSEQVYLIKNCITIFPKFYELIIGRLELKLGGWKSFKKSIAQGTYIRFSRIHSDECQQPYTPLLDYNSISEIDIEMGGHEIRNQ